MLSRGHAIGEVLVGVAEQSQPQGVDDGDAAEGGRPAFVLEAGVGYVPAWVEADAALRALVRELAACGLAGELPYARAEVTVAGVGVVELGRVSPATVWRLVRLLAAARAPSGEPPAVRPTRAA